VLLFAATSLYKRDIRFVRNSNGSTSAIPPRMPKLAQAIQRDPAFSSTCPMAFTECRLAALLLHAPAASLRPAGCKTVMVLRSIKLKLTHCSQRLIRLSAFRRRTSLSIVTKSAEPTTFLAFSSSRLLPLHQTIRHHRQTAGAKN
jgi:hypothetical protein